MIYEERSICTAFSSQSLYVSFCNIVRQKCSFLGLYPIIEIKAIIVKVWPCISGLIVWILTTKTLFEVLFDHWSSIHALLEM